MAELILKFTDEAGAKRQIEMAASPFSIGRTPENDLSIPNPALSRKHAEITRYADVFVLSDSGSSNGTSLNGEELREPAALKNADTIMLGGAVEIEVEIVGAEATDQSENNLQPQTKSFSAPRPEVAAPFWKSVFFIAPVAGVCVLLFAGVLIFALSRKPEREIARTNRAELPETNRRVIEKSSTNEDEEPEETPTPRRTSNGNENVVNSAPGDSPAPENRQSGELETVEKHAYQFLRSISADSNPVLTAKQVALISSKIKTYKSSAALKDNLRAANRSAAGLSAAASSQNLKPAFVTVAALAKLNESRGEPLATANVMADNLGKLGGVLGTELANDCLLVIAAYEEGGSALAMRDKVANLTSKTPNVTAATVRSVWFLRENGKLTEPAFELVLRFLAIGTIAQNPKAFGVDAEPVR